MTTVFYVVLVICFIAFLFCFFQYKRTENQGMYTASSALGAVLILLVLGYALISFLISTPREKQRRVERSYMEMAGEYMGGVMRQDKALSGRQRLLIIDYPKDKRLPGSELSTDVISGLGRALEGSRFEVVGIARPTASTKPKDYWLSAKAFDEAIASHGNVTVVVSLIGMPRDLQQVSFWRKKNAPKLVLIRGSTRFLEDAFKYKAITAALVFQPGKDFKNAKVSSLIKPEELLGRHFLLVTPKNLENQKALYPGLF